MRFSSEANGRIWQRGSPAILGVKAWQRMLQHIYTRQKDRDGQADQRSKSILKELDIIPRHSL